LKNVSTGFAFIELQSIPAPYNPRTTATKDRAVSGSKLAPPASLRDPPIKYKERAVRYHSDIPDFENTIVTILDGQKCPLESKSSVS
jgi:hypothetical protein